MKVKTKKGIKHSNISVKKRKKSESKVSKDKYFKQDFEDDDSKEDKHWQNERTGNKKIQKIDDIESSDSDMDPEEHKKSLMKLKETDLEFYSYLKKNDKNLLDFNLSDTDYDSYNEFDADESELYHKPNDKLEVASDESDFELEDTNDISSGGQIKVTLQLLKVWQNDIQNDKTSKSIKIAVEAFHAALKTISETQEENFIKFKVEGSAIFNGVIQLCILHLPNAFRNFLKLDTNTHFAAHKCKRFIKVKNSLKLYLTDLLTILRNVSSANIQTILLKHLHEMLSYTQSFSSLKKPLLKVLLKFWSTGEETVRVVAFLCILRIATSQKESLLDTLLKSMYVKYVENSKFVSPNTLPGINFMRHSLTEIYLLDSDVSYNHAFLYIRQLAIHLRNAVTLKKKENFQTVYNWQYINSLFFWSKLITLSKKESILHSLLYPLVQIIIGTIKVIPTQQYYPLRFHCLQMLTNISKETKTFIPILPFLLEILSSYDFNKKHKAVSMKPISLICILRMSKSQLQENGFKDSIIDAIYRLILENAANDSHLVCFPDLYFPCIIQLKVFLKNCHVANYCKKLKQLLEKIEENSKYIGNERAKEIFNLKNMTEIENWENRMKIQSTALAKFYNSWIKIHQAQKLKHLTKNDEISEYNLPSLRKSKRKKSNEEDIGSEEESDFELQIKGTEVEKAENTSARRSNKKSKKKIKTTNKKVSEEDDIPTENTDIVTDINSDDWE
ncbi:nucleolar complex protein 2 homolog [Vespa mandarinia]|uniref:nucleolar complex protein 2 homolog n=1 Tax=Vespa mandarinia TaxID=7446 RepID=UPI001609A13A|nr:nucleolar complex protein 2 homolog [Vespa mandarinia]XP_035724575.1 nucleolar complex protein 2 homolog [Vespa mandarinia]XP_035724576.1 nucleolar complex protein 2 homolog [Vespa mandarinia]